MDVLQLTYSMLFHPMQAFGAIASSEVSEQKEDKRLLFSFVMVLVLATMTALISPSLGEWPWSGVQILVGCIISLTSWVFIATTYSVMGWIFGHPFMLQRLLILSAFAMAPWVLLPMLFLIHWNWDGVGPFICFFGLIALFVWTTALFLMALKYTYNFSMSRLLVMVLLPFLMMGVALGWVVGFFSNLGQVLF